MRESNEMYHIYSDVIRFEEHDVDIYDDLEYYNPHGTHKEAPLIWLENREEHATRIIGDYDLHVKAESEVGIDWIETPDGVRHPGDEVYWNVDSNSLRSVIMWARDNHGNHHGTIFPIGNIDEETEVSINIRDERESGWYNDDVEVDIGLSTFEFNNFISGGTGTGSFYEIPREELQYQQWQTNDLE